MTEKRNVRKQTETSAEKEKTAPITPKEEEGERLFTKKQLSESGRFSAERDILSALLEDDAMYTAEQAEKIIAEYMKGRVK